MRAFEAAAAGALLFQEAGNRELPGFFADRCECVYYRDEDLEELLEHYLAHEDERRAKATSSRLTHRANGLALWAATWQRMPAARTLWLMALLRTMFWVSKQCCPTEP